LAENKSEHPNDSEGLTEAQTYSIKAESEKSILETPSNPSKDYNSFEKHEKTILEKKEEEEDIFQTSIQFIEISKTSEKSKAHSPKEPSSIHKVSAIIII
jgi:hypothetical protein